MNGATDRELAEMFGISPSTLVNWRLRHPEFASSLVAGKDLADDRVERSLYNRAVGYTYDSVKVMTRSLGDNAGSEIVEVPIVEHVPPDVKAGIRWLEARRPTTWRRVVGVADVPPDADDVDVSLLSDEERATFRKLLSKATAAAGARGRGGDSVES